MKTKLTSAPLTSRNFILAGKVMGNEHAGAIFTLRVPYSFVEQHQTKDHYTYKVRYKPAHEKNGKKYDETWMVSLLTGPDNSHSYSYIGILNPDTGEFRTTSGSKAGNDAWSVRFIKRIFACLWNYNGASLDDLSRQGFALMHSGRCGMCGKPLTTPASISSGIGPICAAKL